MLPSYFKNAIILTDQDVVNKQVFDFKIVDYILSNYPLRYRSFAEFINAQLTIDPEITETDILFSDEAEIFSRYNNTLYISNYSDRLRYDVTNLNYYIFIISILIWYCNKWAELTTADKFLGLLYLMTFFQFPKTRRAIINFVNESNFFTAEKDYDLINALKYHANEIVSIYLKIYGYNINKIELKKNIFDFLYFFLSNIKTLNLSNIEVAKLANEFSESLMEQDPHPLRMYLNNCSNKLDR